MPIMVKDVGKSGVKKSVKRVPGKSVAMSVRQAPLPNKRADSGNGSVSVAMSVPKKSNYAKMGEELNKGKTLKPLSARAKYKAEKAKKKVKGALFIG